MTERHAGGCLCGELRYLVEGAPLRVSACACTNCRRRTGSAFGLGVYFAGDAVRFTAGSPRRVRTSSDAGRWIENEFCPECGTTVSWTLEVFPGLCAIAGGTFDPPTFWYAAPERFVFARSRPDWVLLPDDLETVDGAPAYGSPDGANRRAARPLG